MCKVVSEIIFKKILIQHAFLKTFCVVNFLETSNRIKNYKLKTNWNLAGGENNFPGKKIPIFCVLIYNSIYKSFSITSAGLFLDIDVFSLFEKVKVHLRKQLV